MSRWTNVTVGEVCSVVAGQSPKGSSFNDIGEGLPFYQGKKNFTEKHLGKPDKWTTQVTKEAQKGDILMSVRAPVGPVNFATQRICIGRGLAAIRASGLLDRDFLFYALLSKQPEIQGNEGAVFASINKKAIESIEIPLPEVVEQKRIVAILDEAFAGIETALANTEKNLANAQELFESHLEKVFSRSARGWEKRTLGELYKIGSSKRVHKKDWRETGVPFYRAREIVKLAQSGSVENDLFITEDQFEEFSSKTGAPRPGDLMITAVGTLGICYVVQPADRFYFKDASVLWFQPKSKINEWFMKYAFRSPVIREQTTDSQGATVGTLTISRANSISISIPNLEEQTKVANSLESLESQVRALEVRLTTKRKLLHELKQSLLQKAFSGELTAETAEREAGTVTA